ncbi:N-glycosylase/DNA lyase [Candidatus Woesearchaeota archaeon]|nr:N-glycosylase/DNA lyase [Candidatus Woesearchaeota archaeon]
MKQAIKCVIGLKQDSIKDLVERRKRDFKSMGKKKDSDIFKELCFCLLTANYTAEGGIRIQKKIGDGFLMFSEKQLAKELKALGHRFPNVRASYIVEARKHLDGLTETIGSMSPMDLREWLVANVKGLGYKESSHFMRNIGLEDVAIVDLHIVDFLVNYGVVDRPKTMTPKRYLEIEEKLRKIGFAAEMSLSELDLYMWYCETGKILK